MAITQLKIFIIFLYIIYLLWNRMKLYDLRLSFRDYTRNIGVNVGYDQMILGVMMQNKTVPQAVSLCIFYLLQQTIVTIILDSLF